MKLAGLVFFLYLIFIPAQAAQFSISPVEFETNYSSYLLSMTRCFCACDLNYTVTRFYWWSVTEWDTGMTLQIDDRPTAEIIRFSQEPYGAVALCGIYKDKGKAIVWVNKNAPSAVIEQILLREGYKTL